MTTPYADVKRNLQGLVSDLDKVSTLFNEGVEIGSLLRTVSTVYAVDLNELTDIDFTNPLTA